jgi:hypothetical protein
MRRPVQRGQALMTVVDPSGDWELELYAPERFMGYITAASQHAPQGLPVAFLLSSHPSQSFAGRVVEVQRTAQTQGPQGATVLVRVAIDKKQLPDLRSETTVAARINCGRKAIGFVWFHDLLETIQTKVLFWI